MNLNISRGRYVILTPFPVRDNFFSTVTAVNLPLENKICCNHILFVYFIPYFIRLFLITAWC